MLETIIVFVTGFKRELGVDESVEQYRVRLSRDDRLDNRAHRRVKMRLPQKNYFAVFRESRSFHSTEADAGRHVTATYIRASP